MNKSIFIFLSFIIIFVMNIINAEVSPKRTKFDNRIKKVLYNPDDIVKVNVKIGFINLIKFSNNETVDKDGGVGIGDPQAWNINLKKNNLFIRPIADNPDTNLIVVTNKRTYFFNLKTVPSSKSVALGVEFIYPENIKIDKTNPCEDNSNNQKNSKYNYNYLIRGSFDIRPKRVYDNGTFTCIVMSKNSAMPTIFKIKNNVESMVNYHVDNNHILIIHEVPKHLMLRLGSDVVEIKNK